MRRSLKIVLLCIGVGAVLGTAAVAISYSFGPGSCTYPTSGMGDSGIGTGGFQIAVTKDGEAVAQYLPGETYTVTLSAPEPYRGFLLQSVEGAPGAPNVDHAGTFVNVGEQYTTGPCVRPESSVGHNGTRRNAPVAQDVFEWVAPPTGTGLITFHAVGVYSRFDWYGEQTPIITVMGEQDVVDTDGSTWSTLKAQYR